MERSDLPTEEQIAEMIQEVKDREQCLFCEKSVPDEEYEWKFVGAGGMIEGPFCDSECQFGWLNQ